MQIKHVPKSRTFLATIAAGALLLAVTPAFALSVPGYAGKTLPQGSANEGCMNEINGGVVNHCGEQTQYEIPMSVNQGSHNVTFYVLNPGGGTFECLLFAADSTGNTTHSNPIFPNASPFILGYTTSSVNVPAQGSMYLWCNINANGQIANVNYSQ